MLEIKLNGVRITIEADESPSKSDSVLRTIREDVGLTQKGLADMVGVARTTISMIESGRNKPSVSLAKELAEVLDCNWTDLYEE